jgi:hypothetical protein
MTVNHNEYQEILRDNDDTRFFIEVHLFAGKLVPVVAIHSIGGSRMLTVDNVNILYVNKQEKWFKYKNIHRSRV